jgi:hypothetical protein
MTWVHTYGSTEHADVVTLGTGGPRNINWVKTTWTLPNTRYVGQDLCGTVLVIHILSIGVRAHHWYDIYVVFNTSGFGGAQLAEVDWNADQKTDQDLQLPTLARSGPWILGYITDDNGTTLEDKIPINSSVASVYVDQRAQSHTPIRVGVRALSMHVTYICKSASRQLRGDIRCRNLRRLLQRHAFRQLKDYKMYDLDSCWYAAQELAREV